MKKFTVEWNAFGILTVEATNREAALEMVRDMTIGEAVERSGDSACGPDIDSCTTEDDEDDEDPRKAAADLVLKGLPTTGSAVNLPISTINSWEMSGYMLPHGWQVKQQVSDLLKSVEDNINQKLREDFNTDCVSYEQAKAILETIGEECDDPNCWCKDGGKRHLDENG